MGMETNDELARLMKTHPNEHTRDWARKELEWRRERARASGRGNDDDGLDFVLGYTTGVPMPSPMGFAGAAIHHAQNSGGGYTHDDNRISDGGSGSFGGSGDSGGGSFDSGGSFD